MKTKILLYLLLISIIALLISCQNSPFEPENPIFSGTVLIETTGPSGSSASLSPTFVWKATGLSYEVVGVFKNSIVVNGKQIQNKNDCFAMWTTGLTGSAGNVDYANFKLVSGGVLTSSAAPSLSSGVTYYWAVWAYNDQMVITNSSAQVSFSPL